jgi:hypothetical protein
MQGSTSISDDFAHHFRTKGCLSNGKRYGASEWRNGLNAAVFAGPAMVPSLRLFFA